MSNDPPTVLASDYAALLRDVRDLLETARNRTCQAVDNLRVQAYWAA